VGSGVHDHCLLREADFSFVIEPRSEALQHDPSLIELRAIDELLGYVASIEEAPAESERPTR